MRVYLDIMGEDFIADVEARVISYGFPAMLDDSGAAPEFDIESITLQRDMPGKLGPAWTVEGQQFHALARCDQVAEQIVEQIYVEAANRRLRNRRKRYA